MTETYLTTTQAAKRLGVTQARIRHLIHAQQVPGAPQRLPGARRIDTPRGPVWEITESAIEAFQRRPEGRPGHFSEDLSPER